VNEISHSIEVSNLTKKYGRVTAIQDVSFKVKSGEVVGFLGPNGAGKSTTMRILCGLMSATSGAAYICGIPVASQPDKIKRLIGYMPENNPLPEDMRVVEYLQYRAGLKDIARKKVKSRVDEALEACELNRKARRKIIGTLSKGFRQRVGIADAILSEPSVIIMDEPTIGLDPHQILTIRKLIDSLRHKMTVIISSHILAEIELCCDRVIIINQGRIVASGTSNSLREEFIKTSAYKITFRGNLEALGALCKDFCSDIEIESLPHPSGETRQVEIKLPHLKDIGEKLLTRIHAQDSLCVSSFHRVEPNLEDIFLAATRRSWEQEIPHKKDHSNSGSGENEHREPSPVNTTGD